MGRAFEYRKASKFARWDKMAKTFSRIGKEIAMAVKEGGTNPESNLALRRAIQNAKGANMPKDNVDRAIKKASGADADQYEEVFYEGYGPNKIAFYIECTTNNTVRTVANVRAIFNKFDGALGKKGELDFIFDRQGVFTIDKSLVSLPLDDFELEAIDGGASEVEVEENEIVIYTPFEEIGNMQHKLDELGIEPKSVEKLRFANVTKSLDVDGTKRILQMIERFEEDDDVQHVFHNMEISAEVESAL